MNNLVNKHMIIISLDALKATDFELMKSLPNFSKCIENGAVARNVKSIYPSLTYPAHTTIVTGNYPKNHGVVNNKLLQPEKIKPDWFWFKKYVNSPTLYDIAKENNFTVASIFWPVSGKSSIKYNMPEIFSNNKYVTQEMISMLTGSPIYQYKMDRKFGYIRDGFSEPKLDNFAVASAVETITNYKPNLLLLHLLDLDSQRHGYGTNSKEATAALTRHDKRIGEIISALKDANIYENTSIVILSDHGFQDFDKSITLNTLFKNQNFITTDKKGTITNWDVYIKSCDGSACVYIKDSQNEKLKAKVKNILVALMMDSSNGIEKIYENSEIIALGGDPNATFMLEALDGFAFSDKITKTLVSPIENSNGSSIGTHGYHPNKPDIDTLFIGCGPGFKSNVNLPHMNLIDIAPTLARVLELNFPTCDGQVVEELIL
ncbi:MAG: ectonucleotide pyrophosphatase/phosphodiesterase [Clostridium sp.]|uniref:alkaline phosphatase family protein n=1 Tax=Clostridium sp. TaxID=1506 RepID=UPI00302AA182